MAIEREFKARMVDNFRDAWIEAFSIADNVSKEQVAEWYDSSGELKKFGDRVSGQIVTMLENVYLHSTKYDYFEKIDDDFLIDPCLFKEIKE